MFLLFLVIILGIVEGLTEFLPVSSTGHLFLAEHMMGISDKDAFWKMFTIVIQLGAILAVVVYFWDRMMGLLKGSFSKQAATPNLMEVRAGAAQGVAGPMGSMLDYQTGGRPSSQISPLLLVLVGTIPVLIVGKLTHKWVEANLEGPFPIACALLIGGLVMLLVEYIRPPAKTPSIEEMTLTQAMGVGLFQILAAVFPGTSRSAATIIGGMALGMSRKAAAEFSFFLAIPAMFAAGSYSIYHHLKEHGRLPADQTLLLVVGTLISFIVAWGIIGAFMAYIRRNSFIPFAVYRIALSLLIFLLLATHALRV